MGECEILACSSIKVAIVWMCAKLADFKFIEDTNCIASGRHYEFVSSASLMLTK